MLWPCYLELRNVQSISSREVVLHNSRAQQFSLTPRISQQFLPIWLELRTLHYQSPKIFHLLFGTLWWIDNQTSFGLQNYTKVSSNLLPQLELTDLKNNATLSFKSLYYPIPLASENCAYISPRVSSLINHYLLELCNPESQWPLHNSSP